MIKMNVNCYKINYSYRIDIIKNRIDSINYTSNRNDCIFDTIRLYEWSDT